MGSAGPFRGKKLSLYEGGVRVPTTIRWPGKITAGGRCNVPILSVDFYPTLLEMTKTAPLTLPI